MPNPIIKGITTIRWGGGAGSLYGATGAIVKKVGHATRGGAPTVIDDTIGFAAIVVLICDGDTLTITCVDDAAVTWPNKGDVVAMTAPGKSSVNFLVIDNNGDLERKREGERVIKAEYYANIVLS